MAAKLVYCTLNDRRPAVSHEASDFFLLSRFLYGHKMGGYDSFCTSALSIRGHMTNSSSSQGGGGDVVAIFLRATSLK